MILAGGSGPSMAAPMATPMNCTSRNRRVCDPVMAVFRRQACGRAGCAGVGDILAEKETCSSASIAGRARGSTPRASTSFLSRRFLRPGSVIGVAYTLGRAPRPRRLGVKTALSVFLNGDERTFVDSVQLVVGADTVIERAAVGTAARGLPPSPLPVALWGCMASGHRSSGRGSEMSRTR